MVTSNHKSNLIGIDIFVGNNKLFSQFLIDSISDQSSNSTNRKISATSAHGIVEAKKNPEFKNTLQSFYLNLPDGVPLVWAGRMDGFKNMQRCSGVDMFEEVMLSTSVKPIQHFFCGGKPGIADELKEAVGVKFNNNQIVGTFSPPFTKMTSNEWIVLGKMINDSGANIVWIGLSTPKQEVFAEELSKYCSVNYIITVGAVFDFFTGHLERGPKFMQKNGLEWLYRLYKEPKRLWRRYAQVIPAFTWIVIKQKLRSILNNTF
jgi:N-acetylglucosaminyldiphosphoundecaprenol N-acetyl-beta-D-mannosaminyltransferase